MNADFLLSHYEYYLPQEQIAQYPANPAHTAKLLVLSQKEGENQYQNLHFSDLATLLTPNDLLLFNQTKVFKARIPLSKAHIIRNSGIEREVDGEIFVYRLQGENIECLVSDDKNFKPGTVINFSEGIQLKSLNYTEQGILFSITGIPLFDFLEKYGQIPLPPYIHYTKEKEQRYQTYFAEEIGSAAAPTASLHFTKELLEQFTKQKIPYHFFTLHVGLGTFKPVYTEDIREHHIHQETMIVPIDTFSKIVQWKKEKKNLIAVGTTMTRFLETLPYLRIYLKQNSDFSFFQKLSTEVIDFRDALTATLSPNEKENYIKECKLQGEKLIVETKLFIYPGFTFKIINQIITNFHLPKSSLLMLVSAARWRKQILQSYEYAIQKGYQFYSFGDGMRITQLKK